MQRVQEDVGLAEKLLHDKYDFTKDETFTVRTNKSPWIADETASEAVWRGQVKSDLLNGVLDKKPTDETVKRLAKRYVSFLRDGEEDEDMDVLEAYLNALTNAYDPPLRLHGARGSPGLQHPGHQAHCHRYRGPFSARMTVTLRSRKSSREARPISTSSSRRATGFSRSARVPTNRSMRFT